MPSEVILHDSNRLCRNFFFSSNALRASIRRLAISFCSNVRLLGFLKAIGNVADSQAHRMLTASLSGKRVTIGHARLAWTWF